MMVFVVKTVEAEATLTEGDREIRELDTKNQEEAKVIEDVQTAHIQIKKTEMLDHSLKGEEMVVINRIIISNQAEQILTPVQT